MQGSPASGGQRIVGDAVARGFGLRTAGFGYDGKLEAEFAARCSQEYRDSRSRRKVVRRWAISPRSQCVETRLRNRRRAARQIRRSSKRRPRSRSSSRRSRACGGRLCAAPVPPALPRLRGSPHTVEPCGTRVKDNALRSTRSRRDRGAGRHWFDQPGYIDVNSLPQLCDPARVVTVR